MKKKIIIFDKNTLISSIMALITVVIWIGFEVYRTLTKTTIAKVTQEQMRPLDSKLNKEVVQQLKNNLSFNEEELNQVFTPSLEIKASSENEDQEATGAAAPTLY